MEHSIQLISQLKSKDLIELRSLFRKYNANNELLISPLVILLGEHPIKHSNLYKQKK